MKKLFILLSFITLFTFNSCSETKKTTSLTSVKTSKSKMTGKIISENFVNKVGKEISTIQDLYFETEGESYFIKFMDSNITYDEAIQLINQTIEIEGEIRDGFWDIPDADPAYAQSRTGMYLVVYKIIN